LTCQHGFSFHSCSHFNCTL